MKNTIIIFVVFCFFVPVLSAGDCYLIKDGRDYDRHIGPAELDLQTDNMSWGYNTGDVLVATGKVKASVKDKDGSKGHNCYVEAQLLLMRGDEILECYTPPRVEGVIGANIYFEHTFTVGSDYGTVENLHIRSRVYAEACFSHPVYGESMISYSQENDHPYDYPTPSAQAQATYPEDPTNLALASSRFFVKLSWSGDDNATHFEVYRKTGSYGTWIKIGTTSSLTYTDQDILIAPGPSSHLQVNTYYYKVRAYNSDCASQAYSNTISVLGTSPQ